MSTTTDPTTTDPGTNPAGPHPERPPKARRGGAFIAAVTLAAVFVVLVLLAATAGGVYLVMKPRGDHPAAQPAASPTAGYTTQAAPVGQTPRAAYLADVHALWPETVRLPDSTMLDMGQAICQIFTDGGTPAMILESSPGRDTVAVMVASGSYLCMEYGLLVEPYRAQLTGG